MEYVILFLEGIITFISPCLLPMLPIYVTYFIGDLDDGDTKTVNHKFMALKNAIGFVLGFSIVFVLLGAAAGSIGSFLYKYNKLINVVTGGIIVIFGLSYLGIIKIPAFSKVYRKNTNIEPVKFYKAILFGMVFSIGWTPCVGTFLGSALLLAANSQTVLKGSLMLLSFSLGLGIPFIISALLLDSMMGALEFIKRHHIIINRVAGIFLILIGLLMMTGQFARFLGLFV